MTPEQRAARNAKWQAILDALSRPLTPEESAEEEEIHRAVGEIAAVRSAMLRGEIEGQLPAPEPRVGWREPGISMDERDRRYRLEHDLPPSGWEPPEEVDYEIVMRSSSFDEIEEAVIEWWRENGRPRP